MLLRFALFLGAGLLPKRKLKGMFCPMRGGFFILQLHDELLYEVAEEDVVQVCCSVYYVGSRWWGSE
jgi:DNA polymerase theta